MRSPQLILLIALTLTIVNLVLLIWHQPAAAQSTSITNTELIMLRNRVSRLENQVYRANQLNRNQFEPSPSSPPTAITETPPVVDGEPIGQTSPMYQRLATLVIELKEDVRALQQQVNQLQAQIK
jgi:hypothetical protein